MTKRTLAKIALPLLLLIVGMFATANQVGAQEPAATPSAEDAKQSPDESGAACSIVEGSADDGAFFSAEPIDGGSSGTITIQITITIGENGETSFTFPAEATSLDELPDSIEDTVCVVESAPTDEGEGGTEPATGTGEEATGEESQSPDESENCTVVSETKNPDGTTDRVLNCKSN